MKSSPPFRIRPFRIIDPAEYLRLFVVEELAWLRTQALDPTLTPGHALVIVSQAYALRQSESVLRKAR